MSCMRHVTHEHMSHGTHELYERTHVTYEYVVENGYGVICDMSHMSHVTHELYENTHVTYEYVVENGYGVICGVMYDV